jgi:hypothetical protein
MLVGKQQSIRYYAKSWLPARTIVAESIASRKEGDETGEIMVLKQFCPVSIFFKPNNVTLCSCHQPSIKLNTTVYEINMV